MNPGLLGEKQDPNPLCNAAPLGRPALLHLPGLRDFGVWQIDTESYRQLKNHYNRYFRVQRYVGLAAIL